MPLVNIEQFICEERAYRQGGFLASRMHAIADEYSLIAGRNGWLPTRHTKFVPDVMNKETTACRNGNGSVPKLARSAEHNLFDHFYTFKSESGRHFWATCPYTNLSAKKLRSIFESNGITPVDIIQNSPYGSVMILFDPENIAAAYSDE